MHRRRLAEHLAPWTLMVVLALIWWGGARLVQWSGVRAWLRPPSAAEVGPAPNPVPDPQPDVAAPVDESSSTSRARNIARGPVITFEDITDLRARRLTVPVQGVSVETLVSSYRDARDPTRRHEAMDIPSARRTPVLAVEDGRVAKLMESQRGGLTVYQFDTTEQFSYYYAHLDGYASGLTEGARVQRGQILGYVGTTGNAPENAPHLHFAIFKLGAERRWWDGTPLDPYFIWR